MRIFILGLILLCTGTVLHAYPWGYRHHPARGTVVVNLPSRFITLNYGGAPYFFCDGVYYRRMGPRYIVVDAPTVVVPPPPVVVVPAPPVIASSVPVEPPPVPTTDPPASSTVTPSKDTFIVNIPDSKGGYKPITIKRSGKGFVGPQGEFYPKFPKVDHLKVMYGE
jgi:hypothetical protein